MTTTSTTTADDEDWTIPPQIAWGLAFLCLILFPTATNVFQFLTGPREAYAELRLALGEETYVIAKNAGTGQIRIGDGEWLRQICLRFDGGDPFSPETLGTIPPTSYAIAVVRTPGAVKLPVKVLLDGSIGMEPYRLRLITPVEETQILFGTLVVLWMLFTVGIRLQKWYRDSDFAMSGRR